MILWFSQQSGQLYPSVITPVPGIATRVRPASPTCARPRVTPCYKERPFWDLNKHKAKPEVPNPAETLLKRVA
jgi:hypothetical protein